VLGIGILTATVLYLSFGAMKQLADSPTGAKVIATGTQHAKATVEGLQSQTCQKALGGFLDPRVWLTEDLEAQWQKSVEACLAR
jgi:hypothetical protein